MANFLRTLIPLLCSLALLIALPNPARSQSEYTSFTYDFNGEQPTTLTYQGDAHFPMDSTSLRLTATNAAGAPQTYSTGRVVYSSPVLFRIGRSQAEFQTTIKFYIRSVNSDPADGLVFFIGPVGYGIPSGSTGGNFGVFNPSGSTPSVFAVEFDTYVNGWDPSYRHVGIDIESSNSANATRVDNVLVNQLVTAVIRYVGATNLITVSVDSGSYDFEVSYVHDLSTVLPEQVQVGIAATTGGQVAIHDVIAWYFTSTIVHTGADEEAHIRQIV